MFGMECIDEMEYRFYDQLSDPVSSVPSVMEIDRSAYCRYFNAKLGADNTAWPDIMAHYGLGDINQQGLLYLNCSYEPVLK